MGKSRRSRNPLAHAAGELRRVEVRLVFQSVATFVRVHSFPVVAEVGIPSQRPEIR